MARISVEQKALTDSRFTQLGLALCPEGMAQSGYFLHALGLGAMIFVWNACQERSRHALHYVEIEALGLQLGIVRGRFPEAIIMSELGTWSNRKETHVRIKGTEGRIEWLEKRREDGKKGGRPSKTLGLSTGLDKKHPGNNPPTPTPTPTPAPTEESETTTTLVRPRRSNGARVAPSGIVKPSPLKDPERVKRLEEDFITLYQFYPRHVGKEAAWAAFTKLDPDVDTLREIARDIKKRTTEGEWVPTDPERVRFIPHLGTYLNQRRWTDE
jgi:hypothetical protein